MAPITAVYRLGIEPFLINFINMIEAMIKVQDLKNMDGYKVLDFLRGHKLTVRVQDLEIIKLGDPSNAILTKVGMVPSRFMCHQCSGPLEWLWCPNGHETGPLSWPLTPWGCLD